MEEDQLSSDKGLTTSLSGGHVNTTQASCIHPDRILQINKDSEDSESEGSQAQLDRATTIIQGAERFVEQSRKERNALGKKPCGLS